MERPDLDIVLQGQDSREDGGLMLLKKDEEKMLVGGQHLGSTNPKKTETPFKLFW